VYELQDLRGESIDGQQYLEELTAVKITRKTEYQVDYQWTRVSGAALANIL
jgi:hypothetical protein